MGLELSELSYLAAVWVKFIKSCFADMYRMKNSSQIEEENW